MPPESQFQNQNLNTPNDKKPLIVGTVVLIAVVILVGGYFLFNDWTESLNNIESVEEEEVEEEETVDADFDTSNWQTYRSDEHGFEVQFPEDFKVELKGTREQNLTITKGVEAGKMILSLSFIRNRQILQNSMIPNPNTEFKGYEAIIYSLEGCVDDFDATGTPNCAGYQLEVFDGPGEISSYYPSIPTRSGMVINYILYRDASTYHVVDPVERSKLYGNPVEIYKKYEPLIKEILFTFKFIE